MTVCWVGMITNAFVHTPMYAYYFLSTFSKGVRRFGIFITPIQILQFIVCLLSLSPEAVGAAGGWPECGSATRRSVVWVYFNYLIFLCLFIQLFVAKMKARTDRNAKVE